ncbi:putative Ig domain-containing protein, partial [Limnohabitans lacus]
LTYTASLVGGGALPAWLTFDAGTRTFSGNPTGAGTTSVRVTATDGGGLNVSDDFDITAVAAPSLSTTLSSAVTNFDVRSSIVLSVGETVTAKNGGTITLTDLGGTGYQGENTTHTQTFSVTDTSRVTIVGTGANTKIIINPGFDLDLGSNYSLAVSTGAFTGGTTGQDTQAFTTVNFSTVAPGAGFANAAQAQSMNTTTGALENSLKWFDATAIGNVFAGQGNGTTLDFSTGDFVAVVKGAILTSGANANTVLQGAGNMLLNNFGANDLLYVDNQDHTNTNPQGSLNANVFAGGLGTTNQPFQLAVEGTDSTNGGAYFIDFAIASGITLPASVVTDQLLQNVISNNWSNTGMVIAG